MAEIVGTITNLSDFLSKTQVCLSVKPNDPQQQIICSRQIGSILSLLFRERLDGMTTILKCFCTICLAAASFWEI